MNEPLKDIPSPVPNDSSQSHGQPHTHPPDFAAPLHERLPLEIFIAIIHLCVGFKTPVRDLVTLQLACRRWHGIIADTSFLWGTINTAEGWPAVRKALQMAKDSLIDIKFKNSGKATDQTEFSKLAREKLNQWRSFAVESWKWEPPLAGLLSRLERPPNLDTLHVGTTRGLDGEDEEIVLFGGDPAPGLKDVWFANVPINRTSLQLSGLKSLRLEGMSSVSAIEVMTLITASPGLEILHLVSLKGAVLPTEAAPGQSNLASNSVIDLAFLIELKLFWLNLPFLSYLLSSLTFPQLHSLQVGCQLKENAAFQLGETAGMNRLDPSMNSIASSAQMYEVTLSPWGYYDVNIGGLNVTISCLGDSYMDQFLETFTWLSGHLEQSLHDLPLHLNLKRYGPAPSFLEWFTNHTHVTTLTLESDPFGRPGLERVIPFLGRPRSLPSSPPNWLLPELEVFHTNLARMDGDFAIIGMIEARHAASRASAARANRVFPKQFREIRLVHNEGAYTGPPPNAEFMSKVVQAAEGADVYWEGKKWVES